MPPPESDSIDDKRVFDTRRASRTVWVASDLGVTRVAVAGANVGRFSLAVECVATAVVVVGDDVFVATDEALLRGQDGTFQATGFGPAVAVGTADGLPLGASPDGTLRTYVAGEWSPRGTVPSGVRRLDWPLVATADGVYHVGTGVEHAGLDDARDVAARGPYAATGSGLFVRQDGWAKTLAGEASVVVDGTPAHAVVDGRLRALVQDSWDPCSLPTEGRVTDVVVDDRVFALTGSGTLLVSEAGKNGPAWRSRELGLEGARSLAVA